MNLVKVAGKYLLHLAALAVVLFLGAIAPGFIALVPGLPSDSKMAVITLISVPPYPLHLLFAVLVAFALTREFRHREGIWVFVLPMLWFGVGFLSMVRSSGSVMDPSQTLPWALFFGRDFLTAEAGTVLYPLTYTLPFLASIAYSVGAFFGNRSPEGQRPHHDSLEGENLEL